MSQHWGQCRGDVATLLFDSCDVATLECGCHDIGGHSGADVPTLRRNFLLSDFCLFSSFYFSIFSSFL